MSKYQTTSPILIPAPTKGMTTENHFANPMEGYARMLKNAQVKRGSVRIRGDQDKVETHTAPGSATEIVWFDPILDEFLWDDGKIYDGSDVLVTDPAGLSSYPVAEGRYRDQIILCSLEGTSEAAIQNNGGTWGAFAFTPNTLTTSEYAGSCEYRGRCYLWGYDAGTGEAIIEYSGLNAINGALGAFNVTEFLDDGKILYCQSATIEGGDSTREVFCIYADNGVVLVYEGGNPGSSTWNLKAKYKLTPPISAFMFTKLDGDIIVGGKDYAYSTRALFVEGTTGLVQNSFTTAIDTLYKKAAYLAADLDTQAYPHIYYMLAYDAIVFNMQWAIDVVNSDENDVTESNTQEYRRVQLVYFRDSQAWSIWDVPQMNYPVKTTSSDLPQWAGGLQEWALDWKATEYQVDEVAAFNEVTDADITRLGAATDAFRGVEFVWTTPPLLVAELTNAHYTALRPYIQQDDGFRLTSGGFIGLFSDYHDDGGQDLGLGKFLRDDSSYIVGNVTDDTGNPRARNGLYSPMINASLQEEVVSAHLRIGTHEVRNDHSARWSEYLGMKVFFEQGGAL